MRFHPIYYMINGWPSLEKTVQMADQYVQHGVKAIQIDMPSTDPYGESQYIKDRMAFAIHKYGLNYDVFMDNIRRIRRDHPELRIYIIIYPDVFAAIGPARFVEFCKEVGVYCAAVAGNEGKDYLMRNGVRTSDGVTYYLPEEQVVRALSTGNIVNLRSKKDHPEWVPRDGMDSWKDRIAYLRGRGITAPIIAMAGILTGEQLREAKDAGADGAYIGTVLMQLWDDEEALWRKLDELETAAGE